MKFHCNLILLISAPAITIISMIWGVFQPPPLQAQTPRDYTSPTGYTWDRFPKPWVSSDFSPEERAKIWRSLAKAQAAMRTSGTKGSAMSRCVKMYTNLPTSEYDGTAPDTGAGVYVANWPASTHRRLYINRYASNDRTLGKAPVGIISLNSSPNTHFKINLNSVAIPMRTEDQIAGTIVHEILHNWGYRHSRYDRSGSDEDRRGNFVYEVGWCAARGGQDKQPGSLSLTGDNGDEFFVD